MERTRRWTKAVQAALLVAVPAVWGGGPVQAQEPPGPGRVVELLFEAMKAGDADAMAALMHPEARLVTTSVRDGAPVARVVGVDGWIDGVRRSTRVLDERLHSTEVRIDGPLASVWTGYDLFVDGVHSHCGFDHVLLVLGEDGWRIVHLADTRRTEGCPGR